MYPYRKWTTGDWVELRRPRDYQVKTENFRIAVNAWARKNGKSVQFIDSSPEGVTLRILDGGPYCYHCGETYIKRSSNHRYCESCVPQDDAAASMRMSNYGLPNSQYLKAKAVNNGICPICNVWEATVIDHDHGCCGLVKKDGPTCGQCNRGLLCVGCNIMIEKVESGRITDIPIQAALYLELD